MVLIAEASLQRNHEAGWRFLNRGPALPDGWSVLTVTDGVRSWSFDCESEGNNTFRIRGPEWRGFVKDRVGAMVSLSKEEDEDIHRIRVRQRGG